MKSASHIGWMIVLIALISVSCTQQEQGQETGSLEEPIEIEGFLVKAPDYREVYPDTLWEELDVSLSVCPSFQQDGTWGVEFIWFRVAERPDKLLTLEDLLLLEEEGVIDEATILKNVRYRFAVNANSLEEATSNARERMAGNDWPPAEVLSRMEGFPQ